MYGDTYVDVESGNDRTLTFYFDEIREELEEVEPKKSLAVVTARAFSRETGEAVGEMRDEEIFTDNAIFKNCKRVVEIKWAYESFWNDLNPNSEDVVFVQSVKLSK